MSENAVGKNSGSARSWGGSLGDVGNHGFPLVSNVSWSAPGDSLGSRPRPREEAAGDAVGTNCKSVCFYIVLKISG